MKRLFAILAFVLVVAQLFAATYTIRSYTFDVQGKTKEDSLEEFIGEADVSFESEEKLKAFLDEKRQLLLNLRVFHIVEYTYEARPNGTGEFFVNVTFHITDASTFLAIPYPKYDSNYGLSLKLKAKDSNLFGTFTTLDSTLAFTQRNNSFQDGLLEWDFSVDELRIKDAKLSVSHIGAMDFQSWTSSYLGASTSFSNVHFWDIAMNGSFTFKFAPKADEKNSPWGLKTIGGSLGFSFENPKLRSASLSSSVEYDFTAEKLTTDTTFSYKYDHAWGITSDTNLYTLDYKNSASGSYVRFGTGASRPFSFDKGSFTPSVMVYVRFYYNLQEVDPYYVITLPISYGRVDWVDNNFRKGYKLSLTATDTFHLENIENHHHTLSLSGYAEGHYPLTSWFNPSARVNFGLNNDGWSVNSGLAYSWNMRGIRDDNPTINSYRKFAMSFNLDLMVNFIRINGLCKTYATPFMDFFMGSDGNGGFDKLMTVGAEGIVILDSHPSYPIRGSLGFNAADLLSWAKGEIGLTDVEWELFIGLYFLY